MHPGVNKNRNSKIYSEKNYNITINNDSSHQDFLQDKIKEEKIVQQKKQIDTIMQGIIKQRLFGNFICDDNRLSLENYIALDQICKNKINNRVKAHTLKSLQRTIDSVPHRTLETSLPRKRTVHNPIETLEMSKTAAFFDKIKEESSEHHKNRSKKHYRKLPSLRDTQIQKSFGGLNYPFERAITTRQMKGDKLFQSSHHKKLVINEKLFSQTYRKWMGLAPNQLIYDVKLTRDIIYSKIKNLTDQKFLEKFFYFFGFPNQFGVKQYIGFIENAANTNLKFIYFWVFMLIDDNSGGVLTMSQMFKFLQKFPDCPYIEQEIYSLVRWLQKNGGNGIEGEAPPQEILTVNKNIRLQQLKQMLKQTTKQRIEVSCVKNTCYHRTILSLEHDHLSRIKLDQLYNTQEATRKLKTKMMENKKKLQNQDGLRLRDFYIIFGSKRPRIFCYFLSLLTNLRPQDFE